MAKSQQGHSLILDSIYPQLASSDAVNGTALPLDGYSRALVSFSGGLVSTGDSDDLITFLVQKNIVTNIASDAASSDWVTITLATQILGPPATSDIPLGLEFIDLDLAEHSLSTGLLRASATGSLGISASMASQFIFYRQTGKNADSAMTITKPASS